MPEGISLTVAATSVALTYRMTNELWNQILEGAAGFRNVTILAPTEAVVITDEVARNFLRDRSTPFWWTALAVQGLGRRPSLPARRPASAPQATLKC